MSILRGSLVCRTAGGAFLWLEAVARQSLVGRSLTKLREGANPVFAGSLAFGTQHVASRRLVRTGHPLSVLALARPYLWLRGALGDRAFGRTVRALDGQVAHSRFADGWWTLPVGAGLFALGCGQLGMLLARGPATVDNTGLSLAHPGLRLAAPAIMVAIGALMLACGPRLGAAFGDSVVGRGLAFVTGHPARPVPAPPDVRGRTGVVVVALAAILAAAAGLAAGLAGGDTPLVAAAAVIVACVLGLLLMRPAALLVVLAAFPWLDWAARNVLGALGPAWDDALVLFSLCLLLWCVVVLRRWELWTVPITLPAVLAFVAAIGSVVINHVPGDVALFALRILFQPLLFYFVGFLLPKDRRWTRRAVTIFVVGGVALALHGLYQYATGAPMPASWVDVRETSIGTRAYSIIQNPNGLGAFLLMGALVSLSMALARGLRRAPRALWAAACAIHVAGVAVTFSRGAWIGLVAGLIALLVIAYRRYLVPLVAAGVVTWFAAPSTFVDRLTFAFSQAYIAKSLAAGRLYVWKMALQYIAAHPWFGLGLGTFGGTCAVTFSYSRLWVDSFYLQLGAEGGLLVLAFFLWILLRAAKGLVKAHGTTSDPHVRALTAGAFGAFVAVAVANLTASVWETLVVGVGFWFLAGFATSTALHETSHAGGRAPQGEGAGRKVTTGEGEL